MILSQHTQRLIRNRGMAALYGIAAEHDCDVSDVLDLLVTTSSTSISVADEPFVPVLVTTPSQPGDTSRSHAPAAETDGAAESSSLPTEPSVDLSGLAAHEQGLIPSPAVPPADDAADGQAETLLSEPSVATTEPPPRRTTNRQRVRECHEAHPDWTADQIADETGLGTQQVRVIASQTSLKLPKASPAKSQEAVELPPTPEARPEPEQPPANIPAAPSLPVLPPPAVQPRPPQGRFYLRERTDITGTPRYVHQSLQPCPTGPGPLMTLDRKWAWHDTMERFKGAVGKWPELATMQKVAANG